MDADQTQTELQLQPASDSLLLSPSNDVGQESGPTSSNSSETESEQSPINELRRSSGRPIKEPRRFEDQFGYSADDLIEKNKERKRKHSTLGEPRPRPAHVPNPAVASVLASVEEAAATSSPYEFAERDSFEELENLIGKRKIDVTQATASQLRQLREMLGELQEIKREIAYLKSTPTVRRPPPPPRPVRSIVSSAGAGGAGGPPAKRPKKRSHKKKMRDEEKQKLYSDICALPADKLCEVLNFVKQICPDAIKYSAPDEAEIEINEIDNDNLWRLDRLCKRLSLLPPVRK